MRKCITLLLLLAMMLSLAGVANAAETGIALSDGSGQPGNTVYLAVSLKDAVTGDSIGISYSYDAAVLEALPESCSWSVKGALQDFDNQNQGVWAAAQSTKLDDTLCVLAFRIRSGIRFTSTEVSCTVSIRHNGKDVGSYTAQATISPGCSHEYGDWTDAGAVGHSRVCSLCQEKQTQSHILDSGKVTENPNSLQTDWKVFTCTVCGAEEQVEIPKENVPGSSEPTSPEETPESMPPIHTAPTESEESNRPSSTQPSYPSNSHNGQGTTASQSSQENQNSDSWQDANSVNGTQDYNDGVFADEHDHSHGDGAMEEEELPLILPSNQDPDSADSHAGHDHGESTTVLSKEEQRRNQVLVFVILAAMFGAGAYFLKKKKRK